MTLHEQTKLKVYSIEACPYAQRSRILLDVKGIDYDLVEIDITRPRPSWFLELNPVGKVPVVTHNGRSINESSVINEYLEEVFKEPSMLPEDPYLRAQARLMIDYCNKNFSVNMYRVLMEQDLDKRERVEARALADWEWVDRVLGQVAPEGGYPFGNFGLVELTFAPFFVRYILNEYFWGFNIPVHLRRVCAWREAMLNHPIVRKTSLSDEDFIKFYADYSLGYSNGAIPAGHSRSSADTSVPLTDRPMPSPRV